jgi:hypothetical protein
LNYGNDRNKICSKFNIFSDTSYQVFIQNDEQGRFVASLAEYYSLIITTVIIIVILEPRMEGFMALKICVSSRMRSEWTKAVNELTKKMPH